MTATGSGLSARALQGVTRLLVLAGLAGLGGCVFGGDSPHYDSAEDAAAAGDWERAAELWYDVHLDEDPKTERTYRETARALFESGDPQSACAMLEQGVRDFPRSLELQEDLAALLERCGYRRAAEAAYTNLLTFAPERLSVLRALGRLRLKLGNERAAEAPLLRVIALSGGDAVTYEQLGRVYEASGRDVLAFDSYRRAIELGCAVPRVLHDAAALANRREVQAEVPDARRRALEWLEQLCALDPQCTSAHYLNGVYLSSLGRSDEAVVALRRAVETDPGCLEALRLLAEIYAKRGDRPRAVEMVERALEIEDDPDRRQELRELIAQG